MSLSDLREAHEKGYRSTADEVWRPDTSAVCLGCGDPWPCDTTVALDLADELRGVVKTLARRHAPWERSMIDPSEIRCRLCDAATSGEDMTVTRDTSWHAETCPWRRARDLAL